MRMKRTERSTKIGANGRHGNAKSFTLEDTHPDAACMYLVRTTAVYMCEESKEIQEGSPTQKVSSSAITD